MASGRKKSARRTPASQKKTPDSAGPGSVDDSSENEFAATDEDTPGTEDDEVADLLPPDPGDQDDENLTDALDLPLDDEESDEHEPIPRPGKVAGKTRNQPAQPVEILEAGKVYEPGKVGRGGSLVRYDPLTAYIQEIRRYDLLDREEEKKLAIRYQEERDVESARRLVTANLRLVVKIAHEYRKAHQNLLDLIQEGNIGLMQAVRKFDPYRGVKLSTYSSWWIRAYILKFILNNWRLVKIGTTQAQRKLFFNLRKQSEELRRQGIEPGPSSIATALEVPEREVVEMERRLAAPELSLSTPMGRSDSSSPRTYMDMLHDGAARPDEAVAGAEFRELLTANLREFAQTLKGRDAVIYRDRLMTDEPLTLKEIGDRYGITKERARQLEKRLMGKLRDFLRLKMGEAVEVALGLET